MRYGRLAFVELRATVRELLPSRPMRRLVLSFIGGIVILTAAGMTVVSAREQRSPLDGRAAVPALAMMLGFSVAAGIAGAARVHEREHVGSVWRLAPVPAVVSAFMPLAPVILLSGAAAAVVGLPLLASAAATHTSRIPIAVFMTVVATAWSTVVSVMLVAFARTHGGTTRVRQIGAALPGPISTLTILGTPVLARFSSTPNFIVLLGAGTLMWPAAARIAGAAWLRSQQRGWSDTPPAVTPRWGSPGWNRLLVQRTPFAWSVLGLAPLVLMGSAAAPYLARLMAVFLPMLGITHLMRWEHACPDRLALAPGARRHKLRMAVEVSTPLVVVAAGVVALAGTSLTQAVALTTSAVAISGIAFVGSRTLRIVLLATATVTVLLIVSTT